ncbi:prolyl oligopeptidase family serine peptidase [Kiritimatiellaeota bacterium B1221]|nr:prolyl oligopeptidase family serine peptidase [Kiritimatiellaeota bacterium B1221]
MKFEIKKELAFSLEDEGLSFDLYLPVGAKEKIPCIVVIQGGGFRPQDGKRFRPFAEHLADNGFAAALISYRGTPNHKYLDSVSDCKAAVGIAGVYDFVGRFQDEAQLKIQGAAAQKRESNGVWIGEDFDPEGEHWLRASAIRHLDAEDPPLLLLHCKNDKVVPWMQSQDLYREMQAKGVPGEMLITDEGGHAGPENAQKLMVDFFKQTLK